MDDEKTAEAERDEAADPELDEQIRLAQQKADFAELIGEEPGPTVPLRDLIAEHHRKRRAKVQFNILREYLEFQGFVVGVDGSLKRRE